MNENLTKEILDAHFRYFTFSLFNFPNEYLPLMFETSESVEKHVAYLCPLCINNYVILLNGGLLATTEFSLDHVPPESVGGKLKILTCKKCNNDAGGLYENELAKKMNYHAMNVKSVGGEYKISTKILGVQGNYKGHLQKVEDGKYLLDYPEKLKKRANFLKEWLAKTNKNDDWKIEVKIYRPNDKKVSKAILKAAYLICFVNWGYDFIFSLNGILLREYINNKEQDPMSLIPFWIDKNPQKDNLPIGLCNIEKPTEMHSYIVNVPLKIDGYSSIASVLIPNADDENWNRIKEINEFLKNNSTTSVTFSPVQAPMTANIFDGYSKRSKS
jgi:hypothetical protein